MDRSPAQASTTSQPADFRLGSATAVVVLVSGVGASLFLVGVFSLFIWCCAKPDLPASAADSDGASVCDDRDNGPGMSKKALDKLRIIDYQSLVELRGGKDNVECCAVCLADFHPDGEACSNVEEGDRSIRLFPLCGHYFHTDCIRSWLCSYQSCPLCRTSLSAPPTNSSADSVRGEQDTGTRQIVSGDANV